MPRICSAPSEVRAAGTGAAAFAGAAVERRERLRAISVSAESSPENTRLKKARNANTIRFNSMAPSIQDSKPRLAPACKWAGSAFPGLAQSEAHFQRLIHFGHRGR